MSDDITYRHRYKAGNVGDVWKHAALTLLTEALPARPRRWLETHAGAGRYRLETTGEWTAGIGRVDAAGGDRPASIDRFQALASAWRQPDAGGRYPGSPLFLRPALGDADRLTLVELVEEPLAELRTLFADDAVVEVVAGDGYAELTARAGDVDFVFIDPPYLVREEWERVAQATIDATRAGACVALWYPIKALSRPNGLLARLREAGVPTLALDLITGDLAKKKKALAGSGMVITRPPAGLAGRLAEAAAWLGPVLAAGGEWSLRVQAWDA
ncbi:MAG: 23S rRNA (adenine(2030)-N(6))-methyltransferase RlmJ [Myxococcales bacterium]|nr:23S rRNA (adenine(2030)-N(6))-methyltransferase RlmJ [Myxococcales bacterium]